MVKKEQTPINHNFLESVAEVLAQARKNAKTAVNLSMVYAYVEIGRMIVEEEQHGVNRATYGTQLLKELSVYLTEQFGKGYSAENLKLMRITNIDERHFYEIEAVKNGWSLGELKRQYNSSSWNWVQALRLSGGRNGLLLMKNILWWIWFSTIVCCVASSSST